MKLTKYRQYVLGTAREIKGEQSDFWSYIAMGAGVVALFTFLYWNTMVVDTFIQVIEMV